MNTALDLEFKFEKKKFEKKILIHENDVMHHSAIKGLRNNWKSNEQGS